jgi:alkylhydroperoxidase family enzyme
LHRRYGKEVEFLAVYVREAHPTDGWRMTSNDRAGIAIAQPSTSDEREAVAKQCCTLLEMSMPLLVDTMDDRVGHAYSGMPDRLYLIDRNGRVAYKSGRGPFGFKPGELEQSILMLRLEELSPKPSRVALVTNEQAWRLLPPAEIGAGQRLPAWARALVTTLPRTTAGMLELDYQHRAASPLPPILRAEIRWLVASANRCPYARAQAAADLRAAFAADKNLQALGLAEAERRAAADTRLRALETGNVKGISTESLVLLEFARKMTTAAHTVTDDEVRDLVRQLGNWELVRQTGFPLVERRAEWVQGLGERQIVALVQLIAYANFQDRLLLSIGLTQEPGEPLPPLQVRFAPPAESDSPSSPERRPLPLPITLDTPAPKGDSQWSSIDFDSLQKQMESQRAREARIRVPAWDDVRKRLPPGYPASRPLGIRWSLVCLGYQPELANGWVTCMRTFAQEARQDRVFEESLFWVVTRSLNCFY